MKCKKCDGDGFHKFTRETNLENMEWMGDDGPMEYMEKECFYCEGNIEEEEIRPVFINSEETINRISFLVENHHHPSSNRLRMNEDILFIINVDIEARKEELRIVKDKNCLKY